MEEMRSIKDIRKPVGFYFRANWIFSSNFEKILLLIYVGLATWKIIDIIRLIF